MQKIETLILSHLLHNEDFSRKVLPYLKSTYFEDSTERLVFKEIESYIKKHNGIPTKQALQIQLDQQEGLSENDFELSTEYVKTINEPESLEVSSWLLEQSEKFCQDRAIYLAVVDSINILEGKSKTLTKGALPDLLSNALSVSFDPTVGHDYIEDVEERYDFYHKIEDRIEFDLEMFNKITKGGLPQKTLNICLAGTGVGKSLFMCHHAAACLTQNKNVLYITLEMAEERIAERIDANLLDVSLEQLIELPKTMYVKKIDRVKAKTKGKLIVKEYPTAAASTLHFKALLNELKLKRDFVPDIIFIDYLNICASARIKAGAQVNTYTYVKAIAEELRGMAVEFNVPIVSATQTTRSGFTSTDLGLEDTSESFGLPATADFMFAIISTDELEDLNQILVKQLKNRYNDPTSNKKFIIGIDRAKMRLYDVEQRAQVDLVDSGQEDIPAFDKATGGRLSRKKDFSTLVFED
tara:strand:- start:1983 stop:3386 length:1404 start_codon:yes stop_codon:yes gene_type:complete